MRCLCCKKKVASINTLECRWCGNNYCISCHKMEIHKCEDYGSYRQNCKLELEDKLLASKMIDIKINKI